MVAPLLPPASPILSHHQSRLKSCYHGAQCSAGEDGRMTTLKLVMFCAMLDKKNICLCRCVERQTDSNGTGLLVWLGALWTCPLCEVDVL